MIGRSTARFSLSERTAGRWSSISRAPITSVMLGKGPVRQGPRIETERLLLRRWRSADLEPFARMNADPLVMEHFPGLLERERSDALAAAADALFDDVGYGLFALQVKQGDAFVGFVGVRPLAGDADLSFLGEAEIGWRLAARVWGRGYAPEAARACLASGFDEHGLSEIVSFTTAGNLRSRRVMEKIGMRRDAAGDFEHPRIEPGHPLQPHVLYRLSASDWRRQAQAPSSFDERDAR